MCGGGKTKTSTQSQTYGPPSWVTDAYKGILGQAQGVAGTPYDPNTERQVAGFTPLQTQAFGQTQGIQGSYQPYLTSAGGLATQGASPISAGAIQNYMDPYTQNVIDATQADFATQNARQMQDVNSNAAKVGALTGDRAQVAQALTKEAQDRVQAPIIAGLRSQGYSQALGAAQQDAGRALQGAQLTGALGGLAQQYGYNDINALMSAGGLQQALAQAQFDTASQNAQARAAYPFDTTQWLAGIASGLGSSAGGTSSGTSTTPGPSWISQAIGLGTAALGAFSDERLKTDVEPVGKLFDGQTVYRYRMGSDPRTHIGLIAQEVNDKKPEAVGSAGGYLTVDYGSATQDAVRSRYAGGGGVSPRSYVPQIEITRGSGVVPSAAPQINAGDASSPGMSDILGNYKQAREAMEGFGRLGERMRTTTDPSSGWSTTVNPEGLGGWGNYLQNTFGFSRPFAGGGIVRGYDDGGVVDDPWDDYGDAMPSIEAPAVSRLSWPVDGRLTTGAPVVAGQPAASAGVAPTTTEQGSGLFGWTPTQREALLAAGLGMMASDSPFVGQAIGEGGLAGLKTYQQGQQRAKEEALTRAKMAQSADVARQRLAQAAEAMKFRREQSAIQNKIAEARLAQMQSQAARGELHQVGKSLIRVAPDGTVSEIYKGADGAADDNTPEGRAAAASAYGLDPNSDAGRAYILTGKLPREDQQLLTATDKKAILEADELVAANEGAIKALNEAAALSPKANQGWLAGTRASIGNNLPDLAVPDFISSPESSEATTNLDNAVIGNALAQLKTVFGGNPTEGERKILIDLQGASNQPHNVRIEIFRRAREAAEKRLAFNQQKATALRGGSYYKPGGATASPNDRMMPRITNDAEYDALPSGAEFIDPEGNTRRKP